VLASLSAVAWMQTGYWQDRETLWRHTLACTSRNFMAHKGLAEVLVERGRTDEAIAEFRSALQITPYDVDLYFATAAALVRAGRDDEAMACYAKGLQAESLDPLTRARRRKESAPEPQAMEPTEHEAYVHYNMGVALDSAGRTRAAAAHYEKALQFRPVFALAHFNLANALADLGNVREAIAHYEQALRQEPGYAKAHYNLAWLLATADPAQGGDPGQAVAVAERASRLAGGDLPVVLDVLAVAYAAANRFPEAIATAEKAVEAASTVGAAGLARQIEARLRLYRQGRVYRQAYCPAK
jgi:tetratricopeptide (TPR) repeat protein